MLVQKLGITIYLTSEDNSYGLTFNKFMDGKVFSTQLIGGNSKEIDLSVEKNRNLECKKESFFEYVASKLTEINFQKCNHTSTDSWFVQYI